MVDAKQFLTKSWQQVRKNSADLPKKKQNSTQLFETQKKYTKKKINNNQIYISYYI